MSLATIEHSRNLAPIAMHDYALSAENLKQQVAIVQDAMRAVMRKEHHYGIIPGCGKKPTLLKPGAEVLAHAFRLAPEFKVSREDMGDGHREYEVVCVLIHMPTGGYVGQGLGSCSTMEKKYRYRTGDGEVTDIAVPKSYWDAKKDDPPKAAKILRDAANAAGHEGEKFGTKKDDTGVWRISTFSDSTENPDIADVYNTCLKMAKKRAFVDAVLTCTAASDVFTQDIEDNLEQFGAKPQPNRPKQQAAKPKQQNHAPLNLEEVSAKVNACTTIEQLNTYFNSLGIQQGHPSYEAVVAMCAEVKSFIQSEAANEKF